MRPPRNNTMILLYKSTSSGKKTRYQAGRGFFSVKGRRRSGTWYQKKQGCWLGLDFLPGRTCVLYARLRVKRRPNLVICFPRNRNIKSGLPVFIVVPLHGR